MLIIQTKQKMNTGQHSKTHDLTIC